MGPKVIEILGKVLNKDVVEVPFMHFAPVTVDGIPMEVYRMSYSGLPGFELHVPVEHAPTLYNRIVDDPVSRQAGLKPHGLQAVQGLRSEMWFRGSADVKNVGHYAEIMIDKFVLKGKDFHGRNPDYVPKKEVVMLDVETGKGWEWALHGGKYPVFQNGKQVGVTLSSAYGGRSRRTHAFVNLDGVGLGASPFTIQAHGQEFPAKELAEPLVPFSGKSI